MKVTLPNSLVNHTQLCWGEGCHVRRCGVGHGPVVLAGICPHLAKNTYHTNLFWGGWQITWGFGRFVGVTRSWRFPAIKSSGLRTFQPVIWSKILQVLIRSCWDRCVLQFPMAWWGLMERIATGGENDTSIHLADPLWDAWIMLKYFPHFWRYSLIYSSQLNLMTFYNFNAMGSHYLPSAQLTPRWCMRWTLWVRYTVEPGLHQGWDFLSERFFFGRCLNWNNNTNSCQWKLKPAKVCRVCIALGLGTADNKSAFDFGMLTNPLTMVSLLGNSHSLQGLNHEITQPWEFVRGETDGLEELRRAQNEDNHRCGGSVTAS